MIARKELQTKKSPTEVGQEAAPHTRGFESRLANRGMLGLIQAQAEANHRGEPEHDYYSDHHQEVFQNGGKAFPVHVPIVLLDRARHLMCLVAGISIGQIRGVVGV